MRQARALRAGRQIEKEVAIAGPLEHVGDAELGVGPALFVDQGIERAHHVVAIAGGDESNLAVFGEALAFLAVGLARRRRALRRVIALPIAAERRQIGIVDVRRDAQRAERIGLLADDRPAFSPGRSGRGRAAAQQLLDFAARPERIAPGSRAAKNRAPAAARCSCRGYEPSQVILRTKPSASSANGSRNRIAPSCRPITTAGFTPSRTPMLRNQVDSQSKVWNTVQSALASNARHSLSIEARSWCSDSSTCNRPALGSGTRRRMTMRLRDSAPSTSSSWPSNITCVGMVSPVRPETGAATMTDQLTSKNCRSGK